MIAVAVVHSLRPVRLFATHGLQHARLPCPSPTPRVILLQRLTKLARSRVAQRSGPTGGGGSASLVTNIINHQHHQHQSRFRSGCWASWKVWLIGISLFSAPKAPDRVEASPSALDNSQRLTAIGVSLDAPDSGQSASNSRPLGYRRSLQISPARKGTTARIPRE